MLGLDGLRAVAVLAVLLYHAEPALLPGGFLGVDVFFVLSGYLITSVLLAEWREEGGINLGGFWLGRARRLLPALFFALVGVLVVTVIFYREEVADLRNEVLAASGYVTNWYLIADNQSYFESLGRPPLLRHLWSLAIEEQFYLAWPIIFAGGMQLLKPRGMLFFVGALAVCSTILMAALYGGGADPSRVYYGTDTRLAGLLIGVALAYIWVPSEVRRRSDMVLVDMLGVAALGALTGMFLYFDDSRVLLYYGGFALVALVTAVVVAAAAHPQGRLGTALGVAPLRWIGLRSYAIYLWHWPIIVLTASSADIASGGAGLLVLRIVLTVVMADLSYRLVEVPVRTGGIKRLWWRIKAGEDIRAGRLAVPSAAAVVIATVVAVGMALSVLTAEAPATPSYLAVESVHIMPRPDSADRRLAGRSSPTASPTTSPTQTPTAGAILVPPAPAETARPATPNPVAAQPEDQPSPPAGPSVGYVTAIGDSVMLGAATQLAASIGSIEVDAEVGRQASVAASILQQRRDSGLLGQTVIIHVGNNGDFSSAEFDQIMASLTTVSRVVWVNLRLPRDYEGPNNVVIEGGVRRYSNAVLMDWHAATEGLDNVFWADGIHLRPEGAQLYTELVLEALARP
jgi:peptidoglycan/LPS O-acetylase OafA/YrhL